MNKQIKSQIEKAFRNQIIISCGKKNTTVSNGSGLYRTYSTDDILRNIENGDFTVIKTKQH